MVVALILVDALRFDFVSKRFTPFISSLGMVRPLKTILGYSDAIRASIYSGTFPDKHGYWIKCCFRPDSSPFRGLKILKPIDSLPFFFARRGAKFVLDGTLCKMLKYMYGYHEMAVFNIPLNVVNFFDVSIKGTMERGALKVPTMFDLIREHDLSFQYIDTVRHSFRFMRKFNSISGNEELIFVYIHYLDYAAHRFGIKSQLYIKYLCFVDQIVKAVVNKLVKKFPGELDILLFSDHGIIQTERYLNLTPFIKNSAFGRDYVFFLDSTMIHLWYLNSSRKGEVRNMFKHLQAGSFLSEEERKQLRISFDHRLYGDDIYLLDPPYSIFPNFISLIKPKAMHAYHPKYDHQKGFISLCSSGMNYDLENADSSVIDIFPTVADLLNLKAPSTCEGRSLIIER
jgi:hypothetical protein